MDSATGRAITAISDVRDESFIAASLERQGWEVIYRALTPVGLTDFLNNLGSQAVTVIIGEDFRLQGPSSLNFVNELAVKIYLTDMPDSDHELAELLRSQSHTAPEDWKPLPAVPIIALTSFGRRAGTSTIAVNLAQELALLGVRPLLIDAHSRSPFLSDQLDLFGINRNPLKVELGITLFEARARDDFCIAEESFAQFDIVILDMGETFRPAKAIIGVRDEDYPLQWALHYAQALIVVSQDGAIKGQALIERFRELERLALRKNISVLITLNAMASKRDRQRKKDELEHLLGLGCTYFSRDDRAVAKSVNLQTTLAKAAPKSHLREEIYQYAIEVKRRGA